jgi:FkbM family methyltransferase
MKLDRLRLLASPSRLAFCRRSFVHPWRAHRDLAFLGREPFELVHREGGSARFARGARDHVFWDWYLAERPGELALTERGEVRLATPEHVALLRPGTRDFTTYREIVLDDLYGLRGLPRDLGNVVDLGANAGLFTAAALPRARRVVAVEPMPSEHAQAVRNAEANGGAAAAADVLPRAAAARSGETLRLFLGHRTSTVTSLSAAWAHADGPGESIEVETISLADLLARFGDEPVDLLKCDVEGAEYGIFEGASDALLRRIARIRMEVHVGPGLPDEGLAALRKRLEGLGFALDERQPVGPGSATGARAGVWWLERAPA